MMEALPCLAGKNLRAKRRKEEGKARGEMLRCAQHDKGEARAARLGYGYGKARSRSLTDIRTQRGWVPFLRQGRRDDTKAGVAPNQSSLRTRESISARVSFKARRTAARWRASEEPAGKVVDLTKSAAASRAFSPRSASLR